jgi:hypothetical protein
MADGTRQFEGLSTTEMSPTVSARVNNWLRLIRFPYHLSFAGVLLGAALIAKGLPASPLLSLLAQYLSAALFAATLTAGGLVSGYALFTGAVFSIYLAVLALNICYSAVARRIPWLELVFNAGPHPLRFAMGAALAGGTAPFSLLTGIFLLAFGIAATRRLLEKDAQGWQAREVIEAYSERDFSCCDWRPSAPFFCNWRLTPLSRRRFM